MLELCSSVSTNSDCFDKLFDSVGIMKENVLIFHAFQAQNSEVSTYFWISDYFFSEDFKPTLSFLTASADSLLAVTNTHTFLSLSFPQWCTSNTGVMHMSRLIIKHKDKIERSAGTSI